MNTELYRANLHEVSDGAAMWQGSSKATALGTDEKRANAEQWKPKQ